MGDAKSGTHGAKTSKPDYRYFTKYKINVLKI